MDREDQNDENEDDCPSIQPQQLIQQFEDALNNVEADVETSALASVTKALQILDEFQSSPQLLDPMLERTVLRLTDYYQTQESYSTLIWPYEVLYSLCKVRGHKVVARFLPVKAELLNQVADALQLDHGKSWQRRYCLLLWLSMLSLVPFSLVIFADDMDQQLYSLALKYLGVPGLERDAACQLMARLITRDDTVPKLLPQFYNLLESTWITNSNTKNKDQNSMLSLGFLQTSAMVLKLCDFTTLRIHCKHWFDLLIAGDPTKFSVLYRKYQVKNIERYALLCLKSYQTSSTSTTDDYEECLSLVEQVIDKLFDRLGDKDTVVRYSTSKSIARLIQGMPDQDFGSQIVQLLYDKFDEDVLISEECATKNLQQVSCDLWHGSLLTIAECLRRRLLQPETHFTTLISVLKQALFFEQKQIGSFTTGSNVRDASCYVCWALFRFYPAIDRDVINTLLESLVCLCCYDREVSIRRAAGAAVQEGVGRHGLGDEFEHTVKTVDLVKEVDFFKLGSRKHAFSFTALGLFRLGYHTIVDYGLTHTLKSGYADIRRLVSASLAEIARSFPEYNVDTTILSQLASKCQVMKTLEIDELHGVLYCLGETLKVVTTNTNIDNTVMKDHFNILLDTLEAIDKSDLTQVNELLYSDAFAHLFAYMMDFVPQMDTNQQIRVQTTLSEKLPLTLKRRPHNKRKSVSSDLLNDADQKSILDSVCYALQHMPAQFLDQSLVNQWTAEVENNTLQFAYALGSFRIDQDSGISESTLGFVVRSIAASNTKITPETKSVLIPSLVSLITRDSELSSAYDSEVHAILRGLDFFAISKVRGDVGSLVRVSAIAACTALLPFIKNGPQKHVFTRVFYSRLIRMCLEPLDKVRAVASMALLQCQPEFLQVADTLKRLSKMFKSSLPTKDYFYEVISIWDVLYGLNDDIYRKQYISGLVRLCGVTYGSTAVLNEVPKALIRYLQGLTEEGEDSKVICLLQMVLVLMDGVNRNNTASSLILWSKLIENGYTVPESCQQELVDRIDSLVGKTQISSGGVNQAGVRVLSSLAVGGGNIVKKALLTLVKFLESPDSSVRELASEGLFECCMNISLDEAESIVELMGDKDWIEDEADAETLQSITHLITQLDEAQL